MRYTAADGRRFGLVLGAAFLALGAVGYWRGRNVTGAAFGCIGIALVGGAVVMPSKLGPIERRWMRLSAAISRVTAPVFLAVVYFLVFAPVGMLRRFFGGNPLVHRGGPDGFWIDRRRSPRSSLHRQF